MTENKRATEAFLAAIEAEAKRTRNDDRVYGSDFAKADAYVNKPEDYEDNPEWTEEMFERADWYIGDKLIRRGRPRSEAPKRAVNIRLSPEVLDRFKATGKGWQTRIDAALKEWLAAHPEVGQG
ncbi:BrnA antitoxin family protein [Methyloraptor flagellatus]|uniref:BrnA antitoxin family protein n=1 Tax=Methyloraptor flagellatus TaxID=3162530 RepID=A0AAU7XD37_9HYPH